MKHHLKTSARKLLEATRRGERLRVLEEEERPVLTELKTEAIEEAVEASVKRLLPAGWQRREEEGLPQMRRHGHYRRKLVVGEEVITLWIP